MTFKHDKFDDSPVMRSLEKVAREKGWVESKPLTKSANTKLNLKPSYNLTDNILKLCSGLRQAGLDKYATDIENKYVLFKQAATMYDTHGETGEDLINAAHPKGSHHLEGLDDAVVKTILDKHLDMVNLVNKKPTGKLTNASEILNEVKFVLGDNKSRLISMAGDGDEKTESSTSSGGVVSSAATFGIGTLLTWMVKKIISGGSQSTKAIEIFKEISGGVAPDKMQLEVLKKAIGERNVQATLGKMFPEAKVNEVAVKAVNEVAVKTGNRAARRAAEKVAAEAAKAAAKAAAEAAKATAQGAGNTAIQSAENVALNEVKSPGAWARIAKYLTRPVAGFGGEAAEAGAAGAGATVAGVLAAAVVSTGATYLATSAIYENKFYSDTLKESGYKLIEELKDVQRIDGWNSGKSNNNINESGFNVNFQKCLAASSACNDYVRAPSEKGLLAVKDYADSLQEAVNFAYKLSASARTIFDGDQDMKGGEYRDSGGIFTGLGDYLKTSPMSRLFGAKSPQLADVIINGAEFVRIGRKAIDEANIAINSIAEASEQLQSKEKQTKEVKDVKLAGGPKSLALKNAFKQAKDKIEKLRSIVEAKKLKNKNTLNAHLNRIRDYVVSEGQLFDNSNSKEESASIFNKRLNDEVVTALNEFESVYGK